MGLGKTLQVKLNMIDLNYNCVQVLQKYLW